MPADPADLLRQRGYRVTGQRLAVLRVVTREPHVTADTVAETVRAELGAISLQAVYGLGHGIGCHMGLTRNHPQHGQALAGDSVAALTQQIGGVGRHAPDPI